MLLNAHFTQFRYAFSACAAASTVTSPAFQRLLLLMVLLLLFLLLLFTAVNYSQNSILINIPLYVCVCVCVFCWCESEIPSYSRFKTVRIDKLIAKTDNGASMRALTHGKRQKIVLLTIVLTCLMYEITAIIIHRWKEQHTVKERDRNEFSLAIGTYTLIHLCVCVCV